MAHISINRFTTWHLSDEEEQQGSVFSLLQKQVLQNELARCAEEKINIEFDPADPLAFTQAEAFKRGQIELLEFLLEKSESAELELYNQQQHNLEG